MKTSEGNFSSENRLVKNIDVLELPATPKEVEDLVVNELIKRKFIKSLEEVQVSRFLFRVFDKSLVSRVVTTGTDRSQWSEVHRVNEETAPEILESHNLKPDDIIYSASLSNLISGSSLKNTLQSGTIAISVYDASKLEGVRGIPHADKPKEGLTFKDALIFVLG